MSETKTPRTDALFLKHCQEGPHDDRLAAGIRQAKELLEFTRQLETELAARERELAEITAERDRLREVFQVPATVTDTQFIVARIRLLIHGWRDQHSGALLRLGELERELAELSQRDTCGREELSDLRAKLAASETERERLNESLLKTQRLARDLREERDAAREAIRGAVELLERTRTCHFFVVPIRVTEVLAQLRSCLPAPDCAGAVVRGEAKRIRQLESRLAEEIKWGHRNCTHDDCKSSGSDCPATPPAPGKEGGHES